MITRNTFETAARETLTLLEQIAYEAVDDEGCDTAYVDVSEMFENVEDGFDDDDYDAICSHNASAWMAVAARVRAIDPDWVPNYAEKSFTNPYAFEDARERYYIEREEWYELMDASESFYRMECCGARW